MNNRRRPVEAIRRRLKILGAPERLIWAGLFVGILLAWAWIVPMARDMYGPMTGPSAWMMTTRWDAPRLLLLWLMWAVMMAAMMLPSAVPLLKLYDTAQRKRAAQNVDTAQTFPSLGVYSMAAGYLLVWAGFSVAATVLQRALSNAGIMNPMMEMSSRAAIGVTLLFAGAYQFTPWKTTCLRHCRSPLSFVTQHWQSGSSGALRMGVAHGAYCLGCCWALMLLLFAGGVMNLTVIVGLTLIVLVEKVTPFGARTARALGVVLLAAGVWWIVA